MEGQASGMRWLAPRRIAALTYLWKPSIIMISSYAISQQIFCKSKPPCAGTNPGPKTKERGASEQCCEPVSPKFGTHTIALAGGMMMLRVIQAFKSDVLVMTHEVARVLNSGKSWE